MIWIIYIIAHSLNHAWFNYMFITDQDFHVSQVFAIGIDILALLVFMRYPLKQKLWKLITLFLVLRWILFDLSLNLFLGKGILYVGGGWLDHVFGLAQYPAKLILLIIIIFIYSHKTKKS